MKFSYNWLKEYIDFDFSPQQLADKLTMIGLEVESIEEIKAQFDGVVIGKIKKIAKHPDADKLSICEVMIEEGSPVLQIVCGAKNIQDGDKIALATVGANLSGNFKIKKSNIRGAESNGMICSAAELGLEEKSEGVMILPADAPLGVNFAEYLKIADFVLELSITPNRPDCLSLIGIAREVSALTGNLVKFPENNIEELSKETKDEVDISIEDTVGCPCYTGRVIENVKIAPSDLEMKLKLEKIGLRSVNNVVDITNYVLMEYGHPLHAFDLDLLKGAEKKNIIVRRAKKDETMVAIDNKEYKLSEDILCIADNNNVLAIAGIMGGKSSEVTEQTVNLLLESAYFNPPLIRRGSKKIGLSSDSSYRFERGTDFDVLEEASNRVAYLIAKQASGKILKSIVAVKNKEIKKEWIEFKVEKCNKILGSVISAKEMEDILQRLGCQVKIEKEMIFLVLPPSYRMDLEREIDLVEEIARLYGYNNLASRGSLSKPSLQKSGPLEKIRKLLRSVLVSVGLRELVNYSFINKHYQDKLFLTEDSCLSNPIEIANPVNEDCSVMRTTLIPGFLNNVALNQTKGVFDFAGFEMGRIYLKKNDEIKEEEVFGVVLSGNSRISSWCSQSEKYDFFHLKGVLETVFQRLGVKNYDFVVAPKSFFHPKKGVEIIIKDQVVGYFGEIAFEVLAQYDLKDKVYIAELNIGKLISGMKNNVKFKPLPKYPEVVRDIAFLADKQLQYSDVKKTIKSLNIGILEDFEVFDVYLGDQVPEGKKSLAYSFKYRNENRTLKDEEVNKVHNKIIGVLKDQLGCIIR